MSIEKVTITPEEESRMVRHNYIDSLSFDELKNYAKDLSENIEDLKVLYKHDCVYYELEIADLNEEINTPYS